MCHSGDGTLAMITIDDDGVISEAFGQVIGRSQCTAPACGSSSRCSSQNAVRARTARPMKDSEWRGNARLVVTISDGATSPTALRRFTISKKSAAFSVTTALRFDTAISQTSASPCSARSGTSGTETASWPAPPKPLGDH